MMIAVWIKLIFLMVTANASQVCFDELGCFSDEAPYAHTLERPIARMPWTPEKINTQFLLFTRQNPSNYQTVSAINPSTISSSNFNVSRKSRFIIHGFIEKGDKTWLVEMCQAILQVEDVNCLCVDWRDGAFAAYSQAANNIRVVGAEVAYFINTLMDRFGYNLSDVHVIGHSLGAHAAGEVGKRRPGIARVSGLDPAKPYFQSTPAEVRLDITDAAFVDVIHTDGSSFFIPLGFSGYGMSQAIGHLDFFPNGGEQMPGCGKAQPFGISGLDSVVQGVEENIFCNHHRSFRYYTESIRSPGGFMAYPSASYASFQQGAGFPCPSGGCPLMGHYADQYRGVTAASQTFYLNTGDAEPYSRWRYKVTLRTSGSQNVAGSINLALNGDNGKSISYEIYKGIITMGTSYSKFIDSEVDLGSGNTVTFVWKSSVLNLLNFRIGASVVTLQSGSSGMEISFCSRGGDRDQIPQTLHRCVPDLPV